MLAWGKYFLINFCCFELLHYEFYVLYIACFLLKILACVYYNFKQFNFYLNKKVIHLKKCKTARFRGNLITSTVERMLGTFTLM